MWLQVPHKTWSFLQRQWSCVERLWCFQSGTRPWECAPHRRMSEGSLGTAWSPDNPESLWTPSSYQDTRPADGEEVKESTLPFQTHCWHLYTKNDWMSAMYLSTVTFSAIFQLPVMEWLTWITTRGDWEKYQSGRPNRLIRAVLVSYVSEQRVLRMLPPACTQKQGLEIQRLK